MRDKVTLRGSGCGQEEGTWKDRDWEKWGLAMQKLDENWKEEVL